MRKLTYLLLLSLGLVLITPSQSFAQPDSSCQVFGDGGSSNIPKNTTKRFYTKYIPGAVYSWTIIGGNISITGPRNLHYVDVYGVECGPAQLCVSYSIDGQPPCCICIPVNVTCGGGGGGCCINYVNSTMQFPNIKVKFQTCSPGITLAKLFRRYGNTWVEIDFTTAPSGFNPNYTYNLDITYNFWPFGCNEIFCLKICGYTNGVECCTTNFAIQTDCDGYGNFIGVHDLSYPGCNAPGGGGGGIEVNKPAMAKEKLSLSPNPASNTLQVSFPQKNNISSLQIVDRSGNVIATYSVKGRSSFIIPVMNLKTGDYIIKPDDPMVEAAIFIKQ
jgi:hypothetical protein